MFYDDYERMYREASAETRRHAKAHWAHVYRIGIEERPERDDLPAMAEAILSRIALVEASEAEETEAAEAARLCEALDVLDAQYEHTKGAEAAGVGAEAQMAFYAGCRLMLEVLAGYDIEIQRDEQTGKHRAVRREAAR